MKPKGPRICFFGGGGGRKNQLQGRAIVGILRIAACRGAAIRNAAICDVRSCKCTRLFESKNEIVTILSSWGNRGAAKSQDFERGM